MIETGPDFMFCRGDRILIAADVALNAAPRDSIVFASVNGCAFNVERSAVVGATWLAINVGDEIASGCGRCANLGRETNDGDAVRHQPIGLTDGRLHCTIRQTIANHNAEQAP